MQNSSKILLLCPLKLEYEFLIQAFKAKKCKSSDHTFANKNYTVFEDLPYILSYAGQGKVNYALTAVSIYNYLKAHHKIEIDRLACIGSAGALDPDLKIGDLVFGAITIEHDYKSLLAQFKRPQYDSTVFFKTTVEPKIQFIDFNSVSSKHQIQLQKTKSKINFKSYLGRIASGDEDILTEERVQDIVQTTQAHATAWEGAGGARAANLLKLDFIEIRAISDHCTSRAPQDFKANLKLCMNNLAEFLMHIF